MRESLELLIDLAGETRARAILAEVARPAALAEFERLAALRLVALMREQQVARYAIRDRLELRGYSRATAYRLIEEVISAPPGDATVSTRGLS